jgi:hypothetical protein
VTPAVNFRGRAKISQGNRFKLKERTETIIFAVQNFGAIPV